MADFRTVQTRLWREDDWFQTLPLDGRLLWIYLFTNPSANASGLYRLTLRTVANESGLSVTRVTELLAQFGEVRKAYYDNGLIFVVKMQELQHGGDVSWQLATRIATEVTAIPDCALKDLYLQRYGFPVVTWTVDAENKKHVTIEYQRFAATPLPPAPPPPAELLSVEAPPVSFKPAKPAKPAPPLPVQVQTYLAHGGQFPSGKIGAESKRERCIAFICQHVKDDPASLDLWGRVVTGYCTTWANTSYTIMVNNYYKLGKVPGGNGRGGGTETAQPDPSVTAKWQKFEAKGEEQ